MSDHETYGERYEREAADFAKLAAEVSETADAMRELRQGDLVLSKGVERTEASLRELASMLDRLAKAPLPLCLKSLPAAGKA